jgi:outer membrane immunogenic protein
MKKILSIAAIVVAIAGSASAAEQRSPFAGSYLGLSLGSDMTRGVFADAKDDTDFGVTGGIYAGHRWQITPRTVAGIETSFSASSASPSFNGVTMDRNYSLGVSGVAGYEVVPRVLAFGRVGWETTNVDVRGRGIDDSNWLHGLKVGGGVELPVYQNKMLARVAYDATIYNGDNFDRAGVNSVNHAFTTGMAWKF